MVAAWSFPLKGTEPINKGRTKKIRGKEMHTLKSLQLYTEQEMERILSLLFTFFLYEALGLHLFISVQICIKRGKKTIFAQQIILPVPGWLPAMTNTICNMRILCVALQYLIMLLGPEKFICDPGWQLF